MTIVRESDRTIIFKIRGGFLVKRKPPFFHAPSATGRAT